MSEEELSGVNLVALEDKHRKFPHFNKGFCKYAKSGCKYWHPEENCTTTSCKSKHCPKRHPKICKHGNNCTYQRQGICFYDHITVLETSAYANKQVNESANTKVEILEKKIEQLRTEIDFLRENMIVIMKKFTSVEPSNYAENSENCQKQYNCNTCDFKCKKKITLQKHINTKHTAMVKVDKQDVDFMKENLAEIDVRETTEIVSIEEVKHNHEFSNEELDDWFQMEVLDNEIVYVCNLCDEVFTEIDVLKKHLIQIHTQELNSFYESPSKSNTEGLQSLDDILAEYEDKCD